MAKKPKRKSQTTGDEDTARPTTSQRARSQVKNMPPVATRPHFIDMSIRHTTTAMTRTCVQRAIQLGYDAVCVDTDVGDIGVIVEQGDEDGQPKSKKRKQKASQVANMRMRVIPPPHKVDIDSLDITPVTTNKRVFRQYSRLTCTMNEPSLVHAFCHDPTVAKYDVVCVRPVTEAVMATFATKPDAVDMFTFDVTCDQVPWLYKGKILRRCIDAGISVEIAYSPALKDPQSRRTFLANTRQLLCVTSRAKGCVLSSGAAHPLELRAPYDVANMMHLVDAPADYGKRMISQNAERVLLRAQTRTLTIKGAMCVRKANEVPNEMLRVLRRVAVFKEQLGTVGGDQDEGDDGEMEKTVENKEKPKLLQFV